ncbi:MAG: hypothetical protein AB7O68_16770 [Pirellulales bacterium]
MEKPHQQMLEALGQLKSVQEEQLAEILDRLEHLAETVRENTELLGVLSDIWDEIRCDQEWAARNQRQLPTPLILTSMPLDPAADDWQINRVSKAQINELATRNDESPPSEPTCQRDLF